MRKWILALAGLLVSASAQAHVSAVPYPNVGSLSDLTHQAAFAIFQTALPSRTQVTITSAPYNATCNGVADDTAAFLAFKAAWQGTTPVQLNLPGFCTFNPSGLTNSLIFDGIRDLIVAGNGTATSGLKNLNGGQNWIFGGGFQGRNDSLPTNTANSGDSCVILKTAPSITISNVGPNVPPVSSFTASASGTTLTVTTVPSSPILPGAIIHNVAANPGSFNTIQPYGTAGTSGTGGMGTYALSTTATFSSQSASTSQVSFTASVDTSGVMTVSAIAEGSLAVGLSIYSSNGVYGGTGGDQKGPTTIKSQLTGSAGSTGTYQLDNTASSGAVSSQKFQAAAQIRLTVNSTAGLTSGDTLFVSGVNGQGGLDGRTNGLKWIKVVDGTHVDLFQWTFDGGYLGGGVAGGDRTALTPIGSPVLMTGYTLQSYWGAPYGYPSNPHWFEWKTVQSVNSTTHQVCFTSPLVNTYKDTWPRMNTGSGAGEVDPGGPATLYPIPISWDLTHVYKDFTLDSPSFQTASAGRNVTWSNVTPTGSACMIPSQNETYTWVNNAMSACSIETDKIIGTWNITNTPLTKVHVQSSSIDTINISNSTINQWVGTPKKLNAATATFTSIFGVGTDVYGQSDETICTNCTSVALTKQGSATRVDQTGRAWSMSGGVITIPNAYSYSASNAFSELQSRYMVPGHYSVWEGLGTIGPPRSFPQAGRVFKVTDVTQDLVNTYITTSEVGGFPTGDWVLDGLSIRPHPAPKFTASFLGGSADGALWYNGCTAQAPIYSCANFTRTGGAAGLTLIDGPTMWGEVTTFTFTNNVPYTGGGALAWNTSQFQTLQYLDTSNVTTLISLNINTKLPSSCGSCTRTFTSAGVTNGQVGDTFPASIPAGAVFGADFGQSQFSANTPSDSPQVTIQLRTDQHLP